MTDLTPNITTKTNMSDTDEIVNLTRPTVILIKTVNNFQGVALLYSLGTPLAGYDHVVVSAASPLGAPETYIFGADANGKVLDWLELDGSYKGGLQHAAALNGAGYRVVT